ncbi:unnamed protein product [Brassica oleracea var. botrytis]|uniref:F-box/LRR-repeat protein At2g40920-like n=1 Tax=Brassica oleracea var. oleracea TaxID=109376 RepID=UPI0006A6EB31|nr:PREDICTED: F-box/LRR-repeat protein At2g40920-like [Brassica oleracea var. oleracea]
MCLSTETAELPMHVVTDEILTRLPAKSLMRFKCVSKLWLSLIRSRHFSNRFSKVPSPRLYMCLWDQATIGDNETYTLAPLDTRPSTSTFVVDDNLPDPAIGGYILQNLGGFMIYVYRREPHIYNPATGQLIGFPLRSSDHIVVPPGGEKVVTYYFGYDPLSHKYKAVSLISVFLEETEQVISSMNYIFSQKNKLGYWNKAALTPTDFCPHMPSKGGISIDAIIYYLALVDRDRFVVASFDIRTEEFNMIQVPKLHEDASVDTPDLTLLELGGKATLCDPTNLRDKGVLALWTLEDVGSKKWSCKSLVLKPSQLPLVDSITFRVKGTTQNGKVLLIPKDFLSPFHILSYDMQNNDMRKIEIKGIPDVWFNMYEEADLHFDVMFMDQSESPIYIDFLSCFDWGDGD